MVAGANLLALLALRLRREARRVTSGSARRKPHGFFAFLGVLCIAAPFAAPFWKHLYSRYLNVVPLAFLVIATAKIMWSVHDATSGMPSGVDSPFSYGAGTYLLALAALALAALGLKKPATA